MENRFYVYEHIRLDTMKPFYVGKGSGTRAYAKRGRNDYWRRVVNKHGYIVKKIAENLDEDLAFLTEVERIDQLRRIGIELVNMTDGGEGPSGFKHTDEAKKKRSISLTGHEVSAETRSKIGKANSGRVQTVIEKNKRAKSAIGKKHSDDTKNKMSVSAKCLWADSNRKNRMSIISTERWSSADARNKLSEKLKVTLGTDSVKAKRSALASIQWRDPEKRAAMSAAIKKALADPAVKAKRSAARKLVVYDKRTCPHCEKSGRGANMTRYHFDNCKLKGK